MYSTIEKQLKFATQERIRLEHDNAALKRALSVALESKPKKSAQGSVEIHTLLSEANDKVMQAIHEAIDRIADDPEIEVFLYRLREAGKDIRTARNQAIRIKTRREPE